MSSNNQGCSDDIASISMSFRRWSFSGNEDKDDHHDTLSGSPTSPTSAMRVSHTEGCPTSESYTSTLDTSFNLHSDDGFATQSRFLRIDDLSSALNNDNVQKLFNDYNNLKAINVSNLRSHGFVILAFYTYSDAHKALIDLENQFNARFCPDNEIKELTKYERYLNTATSGKLSVRLHTQSEKKLLSTLETIGRIAKYQHVLLPNNQILLQIEFDDTRDAIKAVEALSKANYDVEKSWHHIALNAQPTRQIIKEQKLQRFVEGGNNQYQQPYWRPTPPAVAIHVPSSPTSIIPWRNQYPQYFTSYQTETTSSPLNETTYTVTSSTTSSMLSPEHSTRKPKHQYQSFTTERNWIDLKRIERGEDTRTTVMIKNIPNRLTTEQLEKYISDVVPRSFDFLYLRMDFKSRSNVGYAFVNFLSVDALYDFASRRINYKWDVYHSEKRMGMTYANVQGKEALTAKFRNSAVMEEEPAFRPIVYYSNGPNVGLREEFPSPNNDRRLARSRANARSYGLYNIQT